MIGNIILAVVILILLLAAVVVVRTCILQPTPAMTAKVELQENERAAAYGEALAKMIRKETGWQFLWERLIFLLDLQ